MYNHSFYLYAFVCGIAGIFHFRKSEGRSVNTERILSLIGHRGPDASAHFSMQGCTLLHTRLKIVDTSAGSNQPFPGGNESRQLVYNGEIFNYRQLGEGLSLQTTGDTEVLYRLLCVQGSAALRSLNGFFAFAFADGEKHKLLVARDRMGIKPLYYHVNEKFIAFASELRPLMEICGPQKLNSRQLYTYLRLNYCAGEETIFENVFRLQPGHAIEADEKGFRINSWYKPLEKEGDSLRHLLDDAVRIRLHADVPVGTYLSGGLDSSIISALARNHKPDLKTFSIGFSDHAYFDESSFSEIVARHIKSDHHVFRLSEEDFISRIDDFLRSIDEPFADSSAFNFYVLSELTSKHVRVALSGDGADELFRGYQKHRAMEMLDSPVNRLLARAGGAALRNAKGGRHGKLSNRIRQLKKLGSLAVLRGAEQIAFLASISQHDEVKCLLKEEAGTTAFDQLLAALPQYEKLAQSDAFDLQVVLADDMLVKADRFSMRHGLEIRCPFLDYRVVEFAIRTEKSKKIAGSIQKKILRETFSDLLPREILTRSKRGFEVPLQRWLTGKLRERVTGEWLNETEINEQGLFVPSEAHRIFNELCHGVAGDNAARTWALIVFQNWRRNFEQYIAR